MVDQEGGFGRGHRADWARRLHDAAHARGLELLPGKAREIVDDKIVQVAQAMRVSEPTAMRYLTDDWPDEFAMALVVDHEAPKLEEQLASGDTEVRAGELSRFIVGLGVAIQEAAWRGADRQLSAAVGEPLDRLTELARSLTQLADQRVRVARSALLGAARHLGELAALLDAGEPHSSEDQVKSQDLARRLQADAQAAEEAARQ